MSWKTKLVDIGLSVFMAWWSKRSEKKEKCGNCGKEGGHGPEGCPEYVHPKQQLDYNRMYLICDTCGKRGHTLKECDVDKKPENVV